MYNLKKVIASICVIAMMLTTVAFGATYSDVAEDSAYYEAVETLNKLEIVTGFEDGTFKPEDGVTRAEMAALIARIQGFGETAKASAVTGFKDVPATHWASGYIANAAGMGIINGYGDGNFGPEDPVLYEQAVKMIMATLGYTPYANENGGYPAGYLAAAQRYDVSLAVANAAVGTEANRGTVAQLLVNAIDTPLMVQARWSTDGTVDYVIADGNTTGYPYQTLMSANLGYVKLRGVVTANPFVAVGTGKAINTEADAEVSIRIDDKFDTINKDFDAVVEGTTVKDFLVGDTDVADYIGRSVIVYVKKVADDYVVVSVAVDTNRNEELVISLDAYDSFNGTDEIAYYKAGANTKTIAKVGGASAIFNNTGMSLASALGNIVANRGGNITLVDNNDAPGYDVVIVKQAQTGVVEEVTAKAVSFYNGLSKLNLNIDETKVVEIIKDGEVIEASELAEWDILSVYWVNKNSDYIVAEVVANQVVGTITSTKGSTTSATTVAYKVADAWYDVADGVYDEGMEIGAGGTFYVDEFGKIAAFVEDAALAGGAAANYAYVNGIKVAEADFGGAGNYEVKVQLITADGVEVFTLKNNAKINNADDTTTTLAVESWVGSISGGTFTPAADSAPTHLTTTEYGKVSALASAVVKYVKNSAGYLTTVTVADFNKAAAEADFATATIAGSNEYDADNSRFIANSGLGNVGGYVEADTIVFITDSEAANCKIGTLADLADKNDYTIIASFKDKKADYTNMIVVAASEVAATSTTDAIAVLGEVGNASNDNGEAIYALGYFQNGELVTANTTADVAANVSGLNAGDIVKVKVDSDGVVVDIDVVWDFATAGIRKVAGFNATSADYVLPTANSTLISANSTTGQAFYGGVVTNFAKNSKLATVGGKEIKLTAAENIYVIDATGRKLNIDTASAGDFTYYEELYDGDTATITDAEGKAIVTSVDADGPDNTPDTADDNAPVYGLVNIADATAQNYGDWIFARFYEDKPVDVIIVKGAELTIE